MRLSRKFLFLSLAIASAALARVANADINFDVEGPNASLFNSSVSVPSCATPFDASSTVNGFCAFGAAGLTVDATSGPSGIQINSIGNISGNWQWFLNSSPQSAGIDSYSPVANDNVLWVVDRPLRVSLSTTTPAVNATTTIAVTGFDPNTATFKPVAGAAIGNTGLTTDISGNASIVASSTAPITFSVTATGFTASQQFIITPRAAQVPVQTITLTIRDGSTTAFAGSVALPDTNSPALLILPNEGTTTPVAVSPLSLLGILETLQASTTSFHITDLQYYSSFNSFIINCLAVPAAGSTPDCFNWTSEINGSVPGVGIDQQILNNGDVVYFFFGPPHQTILSTNSVAAGQSFTATAEQYDLPSGKYKPLTGVTIGVGTQNPDFSFTEVATSTVDSAGQAVFTLNSAGTFAVGIKDDFYFPSATITVTAAPPPSNGGGSGGIVHSNFNIPAGLAFISANQNADGSFDSPFSTDWTAIAFAAADPGTAKVKLRAYLLNTVPTLTSVTDYERHAMALESLGINPYSGTSVNYIAAITNAFDGNQIGTAGDNDDIFALLVLEHAGFTSSDDIIKKEAAFVMSAQHKDGSWDGSPDLTGAAILALGPLFDIAGVNGALGQSVGYLVSSQKPDGGWGNIDSTSWAQTAINGIIEARTPGLTSETFWTSSAGLFPTDALFKAQATDGGAQSPNRVWSTSYAVTAASGKSWGTLLGSYPKPTSSGDNGGGANGGGGSTDVGGTVLDASTSTTSTLPVPAATSTPVTATTTIPLIPVINLSPQTQTATPAPISAPKLKSGKPRIKPAHSQPVPSVLGETVINPTVAETRKQIPAPAPKASHPGLVRKIWNAIMSLLRSLF